MCTCAKFILTMSVFYFHCFSCCPPHVSLMLKGADLGSRCFTGSFRSLQYTQKRRPVIRIQSHMNTTDLNTLPQTTFMHHCHSSSNHQSNINNEPALNIERSTKSKQGAPPSKSKSLKMNTKCEEIAFSALRRWVACP